MHAMTITATCTLTAIPTADVESFTPRAVSQIAPTVSTRVSSPHGIDHER